jgi:hypothetical protein
LVAETSTELRISEYVGTSPTGTIVLLSSPDTLKKNITGVSLTGSDFFDFFGGIC